MNSKNEEISNEIISTYKENSNQTRAEQIVFGWSSVEEAAADVFTSVHRDLLNGEPVFLYKNTSAKSDLCQVVVVRNFDYENPKVTLDYGVGVITAGYTMLYPHIPLEYIAEDLIVDLEKWKVEKEIVDTYKQIVKILEKYGK